MNSANPTMQIPCHRITTDQEDTIHHKTWSEQICTSDGHQRTENSCNFLQQQNWFRPALRGRQRREAARGRRSGLDEDCGAAHRGGTRSNTRTTAALTKMAAATHKGGHDHDDHQIPARVARIKPNQGQPHATGSIALIPC